MTSVDQIMPRLGESEMEDSVTDRQRLSQGVMLYTMPSIRRDEVADVRSPDDFGTQKLTMMRCGCIKVACA